MQKEIVGLIILLISIILAIIIFWEVNGAVTMPQTAASGTRFASDLWGAWNTTNSTANTIFTLLPIVGIIMIAGIMLFYISRFGEGGGI
jgi:hypothetical protein